MVIWSGTILIATMYGGMVWDYYLLQLCMVVWSGTITYCNYVWWYGLGLLLIATMYGGMVWDILNATMYGGMVWDYYFCNYVWWYGLGLLLIATMYGGMVWDYYLLQLCMVIWSGTITYCNYVW